MLLFSRAIRQLIVFGDVDTLIQIPCFSKLYDICAIEEVAAIVNIDILNMVKRQKTRELLILLCRFWQ